MTMDETVEHTVGPDDVTLLAAIGRLWQQVDPPPSDLADGVLARIAAEDLEFDLLTLVESTDALAGVRSAAEPSAEDASEEPGSWQLEYAGSDFKIYLRMTRIEHRTRIDGWVVPARPLTVRLLSEDTDQPLQTAVDQFGRFELAEAPSGLARIVFLDETPTADRPRITPPFWI
jgi:hypothetical protein